MIVALTAQNTVGVRAVEIVPEWMIGAQLTALAEDLPPAALKTGMLAEAAVVRQVARAIRENGWGPLVVDPVMVATSGARLLTTEAEDVIREDLLPLAAVVTPNLDEAAILTGRVVHDVATMERAALAILRFGPAAVLVKGGHLTGINRNGCPGYSSRRSSFQSLAHRDNLNARDRLHAVGRYYRRPRARSFARGLGDQCARFRASRDRVGARLGAGHGPLNHTVSALQSLGDPLDQRPQLTGYPIGSLHHLEVIQFIR